MIKRRLHAYFNTSLFSPLMIEENQGQGEQMFLPKVPKVRFFPSLFLPFIFPHPLFEE
jgi:hypothetical protein